MIVKNALIVATGLCALIASASSTAMFQYNYTLINGDLPSNWNTLDTEYGDWTDVGGSYGCTNWSPPTSSQGKGIAFTQTATDCYQNQERWGQNYIENNISHAIEKDGDRFTENRTITVPEERGAVGILENWLAFTPAYTSWVDTDVLYGCSAWSPDPSTYSTTTNFTQLSVSCKTDQERQRQEREQEKFSQEIRNVGAPVVETQTQTSQSATRSYTVNVGTWTNNGAKYACTNWSPAPSTVTIGQSFTQTANDCKQDQSRTRAESYVDHKTSSTVAVNMPAESQTLSGQTSTQTATGTKETWVAATATYTSWVNSGGVTSCSNWSPDPSTVISGQSFTQTASDCKQAQTRSRQDREQETTTGEIRNKGSAVTETQNITASSSRSATGTKPAAICRWDSNNMVVHFAANTPQNPGVATYRIKWDGAYVYQSYSYPTSVVWGGYTYTSAAGSSKLCRQ